MGKEAHTHPPSASPLVADYNVIREPSSLLVIVLNVTLNTLPLLAVRIIRRTVLKRHPKVRASWGWRYSAVTDSVSREQCGWIPLTSSGAQVPEHCVCHRTFLRLLPWVTQSPGKQEDGFWNSLGN